jgi:hypothetical protein
MLAIGAALGGDLHGRLLWVPLRWISRDRLQFKADCPTGLLISAEK